MKVIKEIPVNDNWKNYLKKLDNGAQVWDFDKIDSTFKDIHIRVIFSERGNKGKTYNLKKYALECFNKNGKPSIWVRNTAITLQMEAKRFLDNNTVMIDPVLWDKLRLRKQGPIYLITKGKKIVFILLSLNDVNKMKGTRLDVNHIIFDEINEDASQIRGGIVKAIDNLVHSATNAVKNYKRIEKTKLWFLGNNKSINHPYLIKLGMRDNTHPLALYSVQYQELKEPIVVKFCAKYSKDQVKDFTRKAFLNKDWKFIHSYMLNEAHHSYFNQSFEEENLRIMPLDINRKLFKEGFLRFTIKYEDNYLNFYAIGGLLGFYNTKHYHVAKVDKSMISKSLITNYQKFMEDGCVYLGTSSRLFSTLVSSQNLSYQDPLSRVLFLNNCFGKVN